LRRPIDWSAEDGQRKLNIGVIGAGGIARRRTIPGMLRARNCRLVAVMDPVGIEQVAAEFGVGAAYTSEEQLLADPNVKAVYIASPVHCHARQIEMAAAAGKHILCEKPLTLDWPALVPPWKPAVVMVCSCKRDT